MWLLMYFDDTSLWVVGGLFPYVYLNVMHISKNIFKSELAVTQETKYLTCLYRVYHGPLKMGNVEVLGGSGTT